MTKLLRTLETDGNTEKAASLPQPFTPLVGTQDVSFAAPPIAPTTSAQIQALTPGHVRHTVSSTSMDSPYTSVGSIGTYKKCKKKSESLKARTKQAKQFHQLKSKAVLKALESLQDKIKALENDRIQAEENLQAIANETNDYKEVLRRKQQQTSAQSDSSVIADPHCRDLEDQLHKAESRCNLLENQLNYMRKMMQTPPQKQLNKIVDSIPPPSSVVPVTLNSTYESQTASSSAQNPPKQINPLTPRLSPRTHTLSPPKDLDDKLSAIEKDHRKLTASQTIAESKIRELEEKMREERHQRKLLQDKASALQTKVESNELLQTIGNAVKRKAKKKKVPKKVLTPLSTLAEDTEASRQRKATKQLRARSLSPSHYHLDVAHIPFVVGQSTSQSHSLGANIQNVLSIMKSHNKLCNEYKCRTLKNPTTNLRKKTNQIDERHSSAPAPVRTSFNESMDDLLIMLQDEFAQLGFEHQDIARNLMKVKFDDERENLEHQLESVINRLDAKNQQLQTVRSHLKNLKTIKVEAESNKKDIAVKCSARGRAPVSAINPSLEILKKVRVLQTTLREDDLIWEK